MIPEGNKLCRDAERVRWEGAGQQEEGDYGGVGWTVRGEKYFENKRRNIGAQTPHRNSVSSYESE